MPVDGFKLQHLRERANKPLRELTLALLLVLTGATLGTLWLIYEVHKEQRAIADLLREHTPEAIDTLAPFPEELKWQFVLTVLLLGVLIASAIVLVLILRGYLSSQQSLRDLARQAADILESTEHGIVTSDRSGRISTINRKAERLLGLEPASHDITLGEIDHQLPGLELEQLARDVLHEAGSREDREFEFHRDGHRIQLAADGHLLRDEADVVRGTVLHLRDVTERQLIRERMRRMEGYMGLGPVAAGLQHEIKNPLGALSLHVQLLNEKLADNPEPEVRDHLGVLKTEISRIGGVLESFREYADANIVERALIEPGEAVARAVRLVAPQAAARGIRVRVEQSDEPSCRIHADVNRVQQVLLNLLLNALEAMSEPGEIRILVRMSGSVVHIEVADSGPGVSPAASKHLFDPYFTTKKHGLGMGLAVCRKIARLHDGELDFENTAAGALFRLTLPAAPLHATA